MGERFQRCDPRKESSLSDKIGGMLEGISDATERQAQEQIQEELQVQTKSV